MGRPLTLWIAGAVLLLAACAKGKEQGDADLGEARGGGVRVTLPEAVGDVPITVSRVPGRPIVLLDPGHGGKDPGATSTSGKLLEKDLALALAKQLRDRLAKRGRVRVALTRGDDRYLTLEQRTAIATRLGAQLFLSLHGDSAPNPLAKGVTVYSLSDVASSAEAARLAAAENRAGGAGESSGGDIVRALLADLRLREQMEQSAALAARIVRRADGRLELRPRPHQFAAFQVLRQSRAPAALVEAGYLSNVDDEARLATAEGREAIVEALASSIEAEAALAAR